MPLSLESDCIVHRHCDLLFRPEVSFCRLDGGVSEQELDLLEITAGFPAELGTRTSEIVGAEVLDADLACRLLDDVPDGPVAEALADFAALADLPQQRTVLDPGCCLPGIDGVLDPERDGDGADATALAAEVGDHPAVLPQLDVGEVEGGQFPSAERAADQQTEDDVVALAFEGLAVGHREQFPRLFLGEPVAEPGPAFSDVRDIGELGGFLGVEHAGVPGLSHQAADGREPDIDGRGGKPLHGAAPLVQQGPAERPTLGEGEELVEGVAVGGLGGRRGHGVDHHLPELALSGGQGADFGRRDQDEGGASLLFLRWSPGNVVFGHELSLPPTIGIVVGKKGCHPDMLNGS